MSKFKKVLALIIIAIPLLTACGNKDVFGTVYTLRLVSRCVLATASTFYLTRPCDSARTHSHAKRHAFCSSFHARLRLTRHFGIHVHSNVHADGTSFAPVHLHSLSTIRCYGHGYTP